MAATLPMGFAGQPVPGVDPEPEALLALQTTAEALTFVGAKPREQGYLCGVLGEDQPDLLDVAALTPAEWEDTIREVKEAAESDGQRLGPHPGG